MTTVNPQLENGHVDINNENAKQFQRTHLSGNEWQILWTVLYKTWGWHKKEDKISLSQFEKATGLTRDSVNEAVKKLVGKKVLFVNKKGYINSYGFNKDYSSWIVPKSILVGFSAPDSRVFGAKVVGKKGHTQTSITQDTIHNTDKIVERITKWAYERATVKPGCLATSFVRIVHNSIKKNGADAVIKIFEKESNAIRFLTRIKNL